MDGVDGAVSGNPLIVLTIELFIITDFRVDDLFRRNYPRVKF